jgi:hypothetical protein
MSATMRKLSAAVLVGIFALGTAACSDFLDVNTNPNAPQEVSPHLYLAPMIYWMVQSEQFDGRFVGRYAQMWILPSTTANALPSTWDRHGYDPGSDNAAQIYRDVYWNFGQNLIDMMTKSRDEERWDLLGVGYVLKAWGWYALTALHGEIIVREAFTPDQYYFAFDSQDYAYQEALMLLDSALVYLGRSDGRVSPSYMAVGDKLFNGDRARWSLYAHGLRARILSHYSNKPNYRPADVIAAVDASFRSVAEDALFTFPNLSPTVSDDRNFWGTSRGNLGSYRQTEFIVGLMDGTAYPDAVDPRMTRMLSVAPDGQYRGLNINTGYGAVVAQRPNNLWGYPGTAAPAPGTPGKYLFDDRPRFPLMTYAQLQFIKAEAALRSNNQGLAREAYLNGINAHIDFVNLRNAEVGNPAIPQITAAERAAFLAHPSIAPATITLSHIMGQKFIAQWGWSFIETWMDLRRYQYTDMDPVSGTQVFRGFAIPLNLYPDNNGKPVQRIRARFNSDYVWNREELDKIGGLAPDYHTKPMWITER